MARRCDPAGVLPLSGKTIGVGPLFTTSGDMEADMQALREWYRPWVGRNHGTT